MKNPKLVWKQPAGLTGEVSQAVDALHAFYVRTMVYGATLSFPKSGMLTDLSPQLVAGFSQQYGTLRHPLTGTLAVTVTAASASGNSVTVHDCYNQTNIFEENAAGKPIVQHGPSDHITEVWVFTRSGGHWQALTDTQKQSCA